MSRRQILTAREQFELLSPWRVAMANDYRGQHQGPDADYGAPLHDIESMMPDYYQHPEYYRTYEPYDHQSESKILHYHGKPDSTLSVYRALPLSAMQKVKYNNEYGRGSYSAAPINSGDWVTTSYDYANEHGNSNLHNEPWTIVHQKVPAKSLYSEGNSIHEWAYNGDPVLAQEHPRAQRQRYRRKRPQAPAPGL